MTKQARHIVFGLKGLIATVSSFAFLFSGAPGAAETQAIHSPLLAQSQFSQATVSRVVESMQQAAGGSMTQQNAGMAVNEAIAAHPGVSMNIVTAALNQMRLNGPVLSEASRAAGASFGVPVSGVLSAMITNTYMNSGKAAARAQIAGLSSVFSDEDVNDFLRQEDFSQLMEAHDLNALATSAGDTSVYDG